MAFKRLRGTHDIYGEDALGFQKIEATARRVFARFGFGELRTPILEEKELFSRALGTETDVVQKEMYEFTDRSGSSVAMRPEGTAGVVRAYLENEIDKSEGLAQFFYVGPMFRSERPQAGRLRQFHQLGVETLGTDSPFYDAQAIHALKTFLDTVGVHGYELKLNNLGTLDERTDYRLVLKKYFEPHLASLCEDCRQRFQKNVFRLLDCKVPSCRAVVRHSPPITGFLTEESRKHFETVTDLLTRAGVSYVLDPLLVRGLDYYTKTVFEVTHSGLGSQDALGAGGRYDRLIESFGGPKVGAVGFAVGAERLLMCLAALRVDKAQAAGYKNIFFVATLGEEAGREGFRLLAELRSAGLHALADFGGKSFKSQMRQADKSRARFVVILGDDELRSGNFNLKNMENGTQEIFPLKEAVSLLKSKREKESCHA